MISKRMKRDFDVLAMGELNPDIIITGLKEAPTLNREIRAEACKKVLGSSTALCAANLSSLGVRTAFCGKVGEDEEGAFVLRELEKRGIGTGFCKTDSASKTGVTFALSWGGDRALVTVPGAIAEFSARDFKMEILSCAKHLHVGSYFLQTALRADIPEIFRTARSLGLTTSLDSGWDDSGEWDYGIKNTLKHTDIFFPNEAEALAITKRSSYREAALELAEFCSLAVIKRGKNGVYCVKEKDAFSAACYEDMPVIDTTGAGDSFNAGFIYGFINGFPPWKCLEYGNACGNITVGVIGGAGRVNLEMVEKVMKDHGRV
jgi:sugar/nucleoside kinase (ribokinase family)